MVNVSDYYLQEGAVCGTSASIGSGKKIYEK